MSKFNFKKVNDVQLNVRISTETSTRIEAIAAYQDVDRTEVIRELIRVGLEEYSKEEL